MFISDIKESTICHIGLALDDYPKVLTKTILEVVDTSCLMIENGVGVLVGKTLNYDF